MTAGSTQLHSSNLLFHRSSKGGGNGINQLKSIREERERFRLILCLSCTIGGIDKGARRSMRVHLVVACLSEGVAQPLQAFVESIARGGAGGLNILLVTISLMLFIARRSGKLTQARCLKLWRPSLSVISAAFVAFCYTLVRNQLH